MWRHCDDERSNHWIVKLTTRKEMMSKPTTAWILKDSSWRWTTLRKWRYKDPIILIAHPNWSLFLCTEPSVHRRKKPHTLVKDRINEHNDMLQHFLIVFNWFQSHGVSREWRKGVLVCQNRSWGQILSSPFWCKCRLSAKSLILSYTDR